MVVPSFSTLLSNSPWQMFSYCRPFSRASFLDKHSDKLIFKLCPRTFNKFRVQDFLPSVKALHICPSLKHCSNLFPAFTLVFSDCLLKKLIFLLCPVTSRTLLDNPLMDPYIFGVHSFRNLLKFSWGLVLKKSPLKITSFDWEGLNSLLWVSFRSSYNSHLGSRLFSA